MGRVIASRRDHRRNWTTVGIILIAILGGIGGGVTPGCAAQHDTGRAEKSLVSDPVPGGGWSGVLCGGSSIGPGIRRTFDFMAAFSLPWYAIIGTQKALAHNLPLVAVILIAVLGPTAGRYFIDLTSGVTPQQFTKGEWFVGTAVVTSMAYIILAGFGLARPSVWPATLIAWLVGFGFRHAVLHYKWNEPEPWHQEQYHVSQGESIHRDEKPLGRGPAPAAG